MATSRTDASTSQDSSSMTSFMLPNIPVQPRNGMIRTYENDTRTFTRPYSAKTVFFYKEGDEYFTGIRVPISKSRYRTIDSLLDDLNKNIEMPFGVRRLTTPMGRTPIEDIQQLQHLGKYVASSSKYSRGINLSALERLKKARAHAQDNLHMESVGGQSFWIPTSPSFKQKLRMSRTLGFNVVPSKQVFFVLNGKGRFYRTLLNPLRLPSMECLLREVSDGLQVAIFRIYSSTGVRIVNVSEILSLTPPKLIACPRHEKAHLTNFVQLPAINPKRYAIRTYKSVSDPSTSTTHSSTNENGIEKKPRGFVSAIRRNTRKTTGVSRKKAIRALPVISTENPRYQKEDRDSGNPNSMSSRQSGTPKIDDDLSLNDEITHQIQYAEEQKDKIIDSDDESRHNTMEEAQKKSDMIREEHMLLNSEDLISIREMDGRGESDEDELPSYRKETPIKRPRSYMEDKHLHETYSDKEDIMLSEDEEDKFSTITSESNREEIIPSDEDEGDGERNIRRTNSDHEEIMPSDEEEFRENKEILNSENSEREDILPSEDEMMYDENMKDEAATKIQAAFRGYNTRKQIKVRFDVKPPNIISIQEQEVFDEETEEQQQDNSASRRTSTPGPAKEKRMTYTISIATGNRWGAETEADLFIQLIGDEQTSKKFTLKQDMDWLQAEEPRFRQQQMDSFHVDAPDLGTINQVLIGHKKKGYGAGIFIDYILITENTMEGRQFVCYCSKWFDSGQVDGRIERTLSVSAFYYVNSIPDESMVSVGRWEFILHNGMEDGIGGTTSNLIVIGYGTAGSSMMRVENDKTMQKVPDTTLIQVDFGEIGELLKVRFEIDGAGDKPDYYLEWIELRDLDTEERLAIRVGKWLDVTGKRSKRPQAFREISIFRSGVQPLEIQSYEGKVIGGNTKLLSDNILHAQLIGDYSDSGIFPLIYNENKKEYTYKVECVHLGRISCVKIIGNFTDTGQAVLEGLSVLQEIWDKHMGGISVAEKVMAVSATVRESTHSPYRYVLKEGKFKELTEDRPYFKVLSFTDMEGLSTRNKKHIFSTDEDSWVLSMAIEGKPSIMPDVAICSAHFSYPMQISDYEENGIITYRLKRKSIGSTDKIRIKIGEMIRGQHLYIKKMKLRNELTLTEIRFPNVDTEFGSHQVYEYSTVYPDIQPKLNILHTISIFTSSCTGSFRPSFNLIGQDGESGSRRFNDKVKFSENSRNNIDIDAVNLGMLRELEVQLEGEENCSWNMSVVISIADSNVQYVSESRLISCAGYKLPLQER